MALTLSQDALSALAFDEAPEATIVVSPDWRVVHWGLAAERLFGWTAAEAIGESIDTLTDPVERHRHAGPVRETAISPDGARRVVMRRHKNGRLMHVEITWRSVLGASGEVKFHVGSKRDVSDEQLRRDVQLIEERYRDLLDSVPDAIVIANDVGSIVLFNLEAARLFGVKAESMIGAAVESLIPERFARGHARHREQFSSQPQRRPMGTGLELRGLRGDGTEFPVEVSLSPLTVGERRFAMAALRDLSERERIEEAQLAASNAQKASIAKTEFLSRMSHELRTPLNAVLGFAQILQLDPMHRLDEAQHRQVDHILRAGHHLLAMMNDLLDVTRIETGALSLSIEPVDVAVVLDEVMEICEPLAKGADVTLASVVDPTALWVQADRLRLRQVLLNLVTNGIKYNRRGGRVDIQVHQAGGTVSFTVRDTGVGLTADQLARLYRPFDRLGAESGSVEGHGIGLVISRGMVHGMNGRIEVESEPGVGSAFTVHLPAAEQRTGLREPAAATAPLTDTSEPALQPAQPRLHLLYVEDNQANIEVLEDLMALRPHWSVRIARTGAEAMACSLGLRPDLMLVDMHLPDTDGIELARRLESGPTTAGIPRAALSADATESRARAASDCGFMRYFKKPLDVQAFLAWLDEFDRQTSAK
ncbi:MAG TPA: PAS domain S-box protein [Burkholderiaceae bacterium]|nr:PAS domain S-box protein [Burkholderiaceae bacterium]